MTEEELRQEIRDEEHLRLLSLGYMVSAGVMAFYSLFALLYVLIGALLLLWTSTPPGNHGGEVPPAVVGLFIGGIGLVFFLLGLTLTALKWRTARCLKQRRALRFCKVIAGVSCLELPYGTLLGVLTFIVVARPTVRRLFQAESASGA